jgi:hypothetical protein
MQNYFKVYFRKTSEESNFYSQILSGSLSEANCERIKERSKLFASSFMLRNSKEEHQER